MQDQNQGLTCRIVCYKLFKTTTENSKPVDKLYSRPVVEFIQLVCSSVYCTGEMTGTR